jgi:hypothetical protein
MHEHGDGINDAPAEAEERLRRVINAVGGMETV